MDNAGRKLEREFNDARKKARYVNTVEMADGTQQGFMESDLKPGANRYVGAEGEAAPSKAGAGRGKAYKKGGRVTGYKGYGIAKKV